MPNVADMPVVVLCGGLGIRLRTVVRDRPKVLAPIAGQPFLHYLLQFLRRQGVRDAILSTGYLGAMVRQAAGDGSRWGLRVRYAEETEPLGTGGALRYAAALHGLDVPFFAMNGDTFFGGDLTRLAAAHPAGAAATLALARVPDAARYGTVHVAEDTGLITRFAEKETAQPAPAWINAGVYVIQPSLLEDVPAGRRVSLEREVFPQHVGSDLYACCFPDAAFLDIGTPADYARAETLLESLLR